MIRLTLLLLFGIGVTMAMLGGDRNLPEGSDPGGPEVTRGTTGDSDLMRGVAPLADAGTPDRPAVPLQDERRAVEIALAATVAPDQPAPARPRTTTLTSEAPALPGPTLKQGDLWYVTGSRVNLRAGPSTSDAVVGQVVLGQPAEILDRSERGWIRIRTADGRQSGFIYGKFLSEDRPG